MSGDTRFWSASREWRFHRQSEVNASHSKTLMRLPTHRTGILNFWSTPRQRCSAAGAEDNDSGAIAPYSKTLSFWVGVIPPYTIGNVVIFWVIQRVAAF